MRIDLHLHTSCSDGSWEPVAVAAEVARRRLVAWSITDHDTCAAWPQIRDCPGAICGVEVSTRFEGRDVHILGLGVDPEAAELAELLRHNRAERRSKVNRIVAHLQQAHGLSIALDQHDDTVVTRSHVAQRLYADGIVPDFRAAFERYLGDGALDALEPADFASVADAAAAIRSAGGVALLAHPALCGGIDVIERLASGLDGIELKHPSHASTLVDMLETLAKKRNWLVSSGSDCHQPPGRIGAYRLSRGQVMPLLQRVGWRDPVFESG